MPSIITSKLPALAQSQIPLVEELKTLIEYLWSGMGNDTLSDLEQLAFLIQIRQKLSSATEPPIVELQGNMSFIMFLKNCCEMVTNKRELAMSDQSTTLTRFMVLETTWILANVAYSPIEMV